MADGGRTDPDKKQTEMNEHMALTLVYKMAEEGREREEAWDWLSPDALLIVLLVSRQRGGGAERRLTPHQTKTETGNRKQFIYSETRWNR